MHRSLKTHQTTHLVALFTAYLAALYCLKAKFEPLASWRSFMTTATGIFGVFLPPVLLLLGVYGFLLGTARAKWRVAVRAWLLAKLYELPKRLVGLNVGLLGLSALLFAGGILLYEIGPVPTRVRNGEVLTLNRKSKPYYVDDTIEVEEGGRIEIGPGVRVLFAPAGGILVKGVIKATGTQSEPIYLSSRNDEIRWRNLTLWGPGTNGSRLQYLTISSGGGMLTINIDRQPHYLFDDDPNAVRQGGGILLVQSSPTIDRCEIRKCQAKFGGGLAIRNGSNPKVSNTTIVENTALDSTLSCGGGIFIVSANPEISFCDISENIAKARSSAGGGIYCGIDARPRIIKNRIVGNFVQGDGGGIYSYGSSDSDVPFEIQNNEIRGNIAQQFGGGICVDYGSSPRIIGNTIIENRTTGFVNIYEKTMTSSGGGIFIGGDPQNPKLSRPKIINNSILRNIASPVDGTIEHLNGTGGGIACFNKTEVVLSNNQIAHNHARIGGGIYHPNDCVILNTQGLEVDSNIPDDIHHADTSFLEGR